MKNDKKNDPFAAEKSRAFRKFSDIAGMTLAIVAIAAAVAELTSSGGYHPRKPSELEMPAPPAVDASTPQAQALVRNAERGKFPSHLQGVVATYNYGQTPTVVVNPFVVPSKQQPGLSGSNDLAYKYNFYALTALKDPKTGKISFIPDAIIVDGADANGDNDSNIGVASTYNHQSPIYSSAPEVTSNSVLAKHTYSFSPGGEAATMKLFNQYTYHAVGNMALMSTDLYDGRAEPEGLLLQVSPKN
jgi:hypothetical protein